MAEQKSADPRSKVGRGGAMKPGLRARLMLADALALTFAASLTELVAGWRSAGMVMETSSFRVVAVMVAGITFARWQQLYVAARCAVRSAELTAIVRVSVLLGAASLVADQFVTTGMRSGRAVALVMLSLTCTTLGRSLFRGWLRAKRSRGEYARPVSLVGTNDDARRIAELLRNHPEAGFELVGVCGDLDGALDAGLRSLWRGGTEEAAKLIRSGETTGAVVVASALETEDLNDVVRDVTAAGGHVHVSSGLWGIASQRIASEPIAHEPLLHIQPKQLDAGQFVVKRAVDIVLATLLLVISGPALLLTMAFIRLSDGGPAVFRQVRVGRGGRTFEVLKLRTMVVDAEARVRELADGNLRQGPLFKLDHDPRVTPIGRFLRATSIDELPQLWNVLRGEMSLVGPRPALPDEVRAFPPSLSSRTNVMPGVTGLWQVEARDNPSFDAYARLDLFYVENWTVTFDLVIMLATVESEISRAVNRFLQRSADRRPAETAEQDRPIELLPEGTLGRNSLLID